MPAPLACPRCHRPLAGDTCACGARFVQDGRVLDIEPDLVLPRGLAQRFMESRAVVRVYERAFRPAISRVVTPLTYADEARFLDTWVEDGPALDLACGTGRYTRWLAERLGDDAVTGLDLSRPMLRRAARDAPGLRFVRASAQALPVADGTLGTVTCFGALHLFPDPAGAVAEIGRALEPGGRFVCLTACASPRGRRVQRRVGRFITLRFVEEADLFAWCDAADLEVDVWEPRGGMGLLAATRR